MQFPVPQFIDIEDKIIFGLTLKQFLWLLAGSIIILMLFFFGGLQLWAFVLVAIPLAGLFTGMALLKINDRPLVNYLFMFLGYLVKPKLFLWQRKK